MVEVRMVRKNINFPIYLLVRVNNLIQGLNVDFSKFVRQATEEHVNNVEKIQLQGELEEGYKAKAKLNFKISEDFKYVDEENI